jgi:hypothetical protein
MTSLVTYITQAEWDARFVAALDSRGIRPMIDQDHLLCRAHYFQSEGLGPESSATEYAAFYHRAEGAAS